MKTPLGRIVAEPVAPREAIEFFRSKGFAPPEQRFDYRDWWGAEHARGFVVAKAMQDDVLALIREHVDRALAEGRTLDRFRADLAPELKRLGWWGRQDMTDPVTGEIREVQLGSSRRLRVIFDTNMRTARAAGRWAAIQRTKRTLPYLQYVQIQRPTKREEHAAWHLMVMRVDHPAWAMIYPPNGYFCGCIVRQLSAGAVERQGLTVTEDPPVIMRAVPNNRTAGVDEVPVGVTPGFAHNPGAAWLDLGERIARNAPDLPPEIRAVELGLAEEVRSRTLRDGVEHLAIYDARDGAVVDWARGTASGVDATPAMERAAADPGRRLTAVHSHPGGLPGYSLSLDDLLPLRSPGLEAVVAVGPDGSVYRATRIDLSGLDFGRLEQEVAKGVRREVARGTIAAGDIRRAHSFVLMLALHDAGRIEYRQSLALAARQIFDLYREVIEDVAIDVSEALG